MVKVKSDTKKGVIYKIELRGDIMQKLEQLMRSGSSTESFDINIYFERNQMIRKQEKIKKIESEKKQMFKKLVEIAKDMKNSGYKVKDIEDITELPKKIIENIR